MYCLNQKLQSFLFFSQLLQQLVLCNIASFYFQRKINFLIHQKVNWTHIGIS